MDENPLPIGTWQKSCGTLCSFVGKTPLQAAGHSVSRSNASESAKSGRFMANPSRSSTIQSICNNAASSGLMLDLRQMRNRPHTLTGQGLGCGVCFDPWRGEDLHEPFDPGAGPIDGTAQLLNLGGTRGADHGVGEKVELGGYLLVGKRRLRIAARCAWP